MSDADVRSQLSGRSDGMTIGEISDLVGVPITTLRSWEQRYCMPPRAGVGGSTRTYTGEQAQMLTLMRDDVLRGVRAAEAAESVRALFDSDRAGAKFVLGLLAAGDRLDVVAVDEWLDRAAAELGIGACLDEVLFPAMRRVGLGWQTKQRDVNYERVMTDAVCGWLLRYAGSISLPSESPLVLLAPSDRHNIGLHALAVLLRGQGIRCGGLSSGLSTTKLRETLQARQPVAVVLLSHLPTARSRAIARLRALQGSGVQVFYAGNAFVSPRSRRGVPGQYLGLNLQQAAQVIAAPVRGGRRGFGALGG